MKTNALYLFIIATSYIYYTKAADCYINTGPDGARQCINLTRFDNFQWATCRNNSYVQRVTNNTFRCTGGLGTYCLFHCMAELYYVSRGHVHNSCRCDPPIPTVPTPSRDPPVPSRDTPVPSRDSHEPPTKSPSRATSGDRDKNSASQKEIPVFVFTACSFGYYLYVHLIWVRCNILKTNTELLSTLCQKFSIGNEICTKFIVYCLVLALMTLAYTDRKLCNSK